MRRGAQIHRYRPDRQIFDEGTETRERSRSVQHRHVLVFTLEKRAQPFWEKISRFENVVIDVLLHM